MKKIISLVLIMFLLIGCDSGKEHGSNQGKEPKQEGVKEEMQESKPATKEFIMETFGFTEEDLAGIEVEEIIEFYGFKEEGVLMNSKSNMLGVLQYYQENLEADKIARAKSKEYLMEAGSYDGDKLDLGSIKNLAFMSNENDAVYMYYIDFINKKEYYAMNPFLLADPEKAEMMGNVEEKDINELVELFEKAHVQDWKASYEGNNGDTTGSWYWQLGMEFADGTVVTYEGYGMFGNNQPKGFKKIEEKLYDMTYFEKVNKDTIEEN